MRFFTTIVLASNAAQVVNAQWLVDSVAAGKPLPSHMYKTDPMGPSPLPDGGYLLFQPTPCPIMV